MPSWIPQSSKCPRKQEHQTVLFRFWHSWIGVSQRALLAEGLLRHGHGGYVCRDSRKVTSPDFDGLKRLQDSHLVGADEELGPYEQLEGRMEIYVEPLGSAEAGQSLLAFIDNALSCPSDTSPL